jgi:VanZ family protein
MRHWFSDINVKLVTFLGAALGYFAVALLSWMPAAYRPNIVIVSDKLEHALAYLLLGALSVIATRQIVNPRWIGLAIVAYAGVLESGQLLIPGRVASVADFVASAAGAIVGVWLITLALRPLPRRADPGETERAET